MHNPNDNNPSKQDIPESLLDETSEVVLVMLESLNQLQEKTEREGFDFLNYLLQMAIMEAQEIASGSNHE
jgi:hypothetical protein